MYNWWRLVGAIVGHVVPPKPKRDGFLMTKVLALLLWLVMKYQHVLPLLTFYITLASSPFMLKASRSSNAEAMHVIGCKMGGCP